MIQIFFSMNSVEALEISKYITCYCRTRKTNTNFILVLINLTIVIAAFHFRLLVKSLTIISMSTCYSNSLLECKGLTISFFVQIVQEKSQVDILRQVIFSLKNTRFPVFVVY